MRITKFTAIIMGFWLISATELLATTFATNLSPSYGRGTADSNLKIVDAVGVGLGTNALFAVTERLAIGPCLELSTATVYGSGTTADGEKVIATYNHRIAAAGLAGQWRLFAKDDAPALYSNVLLGRGTSRVKVDQSTTSQYEASTYDGIKGDYAALELGARFNLTGRLHLLAGLLASQYSADQSAAKGDMRRQSFALFRNDLGREAGGYRNTNGPAEALAGHVTLRTYAAKTGIAFDF